MRNKKYSKYLVFVLVLDVIFALVKILSAQEWGSEHIFARGVSRVVSIVLQDINSLIPFSVVETMVVSLIIGILVLLVAVVVWRERVNTSPAVEKALLVVFVVITCIVTLYILIGTSLYNRSEIYTPLGIKKVKVDEQLVAQSLDHYLDMLIETAPNVARDEDGNVALPYTFEEVNALLNEEYIRLHDDYFTQNNVRLKKIRFSFFMTFTYITGVYVAFLGESSINTNVPSYTLPVTMAHEMAHGKGCVRENDANCIAYYICITSDNDYLRYCGLMSVCATLYSKLSKEQKNVFYDRFPKECLREYDNEYNFYERYESVVEKVSDFVNDMHLKGSGVKEGTQSYLMTDVFLCSMYKSLYAEEK